MNTASAGYGDFLWFGTALYDDREDVTGRHVMIDEFTQKLIYSIGIENFTSEHIADGNWISVSGDLLPHMKAGLQEAWNRGLLLDSQDYADYRIGGVNMGWEMMGLNDASMQIRNYNVVANVATPILPAIPRRCRHQGVVAHGHCRQPRKWLPGLYRRQHLRCTRSPRRP